MNYLCLIHVDEMKVAAVPADAFDSVDREFLAHPDALAKAGRSIACERLESVDIAMTMGVVNGKPSVTDGPSAETREQFSGSYPIDAPTWTRQSAARRTSRRGVRSASRCARPWPRRRQDRNETTRPARL